MYHICIQYIIMVYAYIIYIYIYHNVFYLATLGGKLLLHLKLYEYNSPCYIPDDLLEPGYRKWILFGTCLLAPI